MTQEQVAERIKTANRDMDYRGSLTPYAVKSITEGRSNYPASNLITYCQDMGLRLVMCDLVTEDCFYPESVLGIHRVLDLLMKRYDVDYKLVYRKTAVHYTAPKSFDKKDLEKIQAGPKGKRYAAPLSVRTLLAVCDVIHCDLRFEPN